MKVYLFKFQPVGYDLSRPKIYLWVMLQAQIALSLLTTSVDGRCFTLKDPEAVGGGGVVAK